MGAIARARRAAAPAAVTEREERLAAIVAALLIGAQAAALCAIAVLCVTRLSLTMDMMYHAQPMHLIGRGTLDPFEFGGSSPYRYRYDHGAFLTWAFAPFTRLLPAPVVLEAVDVIAVAAGSWFVWLVVAAEARSLPTELQRWSLRGIALALLVLDPWPYWANAFDYHLHVTAVAFVCGALYFAYRRSPKPCVAMLVCVVLLGDVTSTYAAALGVGLLFRRGMRLAGVIGVVAAAAEFAIVAHMRPHDVSTPRTGTFYAYLLDPAQRRDPSSVEFGAVVAAALRHPDRVFGELWLRRANGWASMSAPGLLGVAHPLTAAIAIVVLLESLLAGPPTFALPGSQLACAYPAIALGTVLTLAALIRRNALLGQLAALLLAANVVGWAATFGPLLPRHWIKYDPQEAAQLDLLRSTIPPTDQVFAPHGAVGAFADRHDVFFEVKTFLRYAVAKPTDVIVTPFAGVNLETTDSIAREISWWLFTQHARLVSVRGDIWYLTLPNGPVTGAVAPDFTQGSVPAWALHVEAGARRIGHTAETSYVEGAREPGYVVTGAIDNVASGPYRVEIRSAGSGSFVLEVYDRDTQRFIVRTAVAATRRVSTTAVDIDVPDGIPSRASLDGGNDVFGIKPYNAHLGSTQIEIRVYEPQRRPLDVYALTIEHR